MADTHHGYVAGRYRNGALSDTWTDVTRCAERTFVAYVARCGCGWLGNDHPSNPYGYHTCQQELLSDHLCSIAGGTLVGLHWAVARGHAGMTDDQDSEPCFHAR
jgi:hypothetical protein